MIGNYLVNVRAWPIIKNVIAKLISYAHPNFSEIRWPLFLTVFITENCNTECEYCWRPNSDTKKYISISTIENLALLNIPIIILSGGEPTTHPEFRKIVDLLNNASSKMHILTNGLYSEALIEAVEGRENIRIVVGFLAGQSESLTRLKIQTILRLKKKGIPVYANLVIDIDENNYIQSVDDADLRRILSIVDRAYVTKKRLRKEFSVN